MKKHIFISVIFSIVLVLGYNNISIFAEDSNVRDMELASAKGVFVNAGWDERDIEQLFIDDELLKYKDAQIVCSKVDKYYRVSENQITEIDKDECLNKVIEIHRMEMSRSLILPGVRTQSIDIGESSSTYNVTNDGYLQYSLTVLRTDTRRYACTAYFTWLVTPVVTGIDVFAVSMNSYLTCLYPTYFCYTVTDALTSVNSSVYTPSVGYNSTTNGVAAVFDLADTIHNAYGEPTYIPINHRGVMTVWADSNINNGTVTARVVVDYVHQQPTLTLTPSISFGGSGSISVSPSTFFKKMLNNLYLDFTV